VRLVLYRLPKRIEPERDDDDDLDPVPFARPLQPSVLPQLIVGLFQLAKPAWEATVGSRPWIVASNDDLPVTMVWRATGRRSATAALDEIADALERGEPRPQPLWAHWVGYDRGGIRLPRKLDG
jgi:hypothetical protein